jgi:hypothetical protein
MAMKRLFLFTSILLLISFPAIGQIESGTFAGTVTDPSGASIPAAVVTITNQATNVSNPFQTDSTGIY